MTEMRDTNERLIIGVLDDGLDDGERPVVREHPVTQLQSLDRPRAVGGIHWGSCGEADTGSPRCFLPELRNVGVAGWKRPSMISSTSFSASIGVTGGQRQRDHHDAVLEALQIALPVEGFQRVGRVVLERPRNVGNRNFLAYARSSSVLTKLREYWSSTSRS